MEKKSITNKITPCSTLPYKIMYWWVMNLKLNTDADRQYIISKLNQSGSISIDAWKVLINSGTLEMDAALTKEGFLAWFDCERQPSKNQLKLLIEGFSMGSYDPTDEYGVGWTEKSTYEEYDGKIIRKIIDFVGGVGTIPAELNNIIGMYYAADGGYTLDKDLATDFIAEPIVLESKQGKNLFDKNTMVEDGLINTNSISYPSGFKLAKIPIEENTHYKLNQIPLLAWFLIQDSSGNNIPNPTPGEGGNYNWNMAAFIGGKLTTPDNAAFLLLNVTHPTAPEEGVNIDNFQVEKGDITTGYEPYKLFLKSVNGIQVPEPNKIPNENYIDLNVVVGGDSITAAIGAIGWVDQLLKNMSFKSFNRYARSGATWTNFSATTDSPLDNSGVNNTISNQIQRVFYDYDNGLIQKPDVMILLAGVNDARDMPLGTIEGAFPAFDSTILQLTPGQVNTLTEAIRWNIERILQKFPDIQIIITTPLQSGNNNLPRVKEVRDLIKECALRMAVEVIDQYGESGIYGFNEIGNNHKYLSDNLHPNSVGAKKVALFLMQQFKMKIIKLYPL